MTDNVYEFRAKAGDTEKITINLGYVDLGHIDLLVQEGFYSNRTDFIRTAIRNQNERHADTTKQSVARKSVELGLRHYTREDLETAQAAGQTLYQISLVGTCRDEGNSAARSEGVLGPPAMSSGHRDVVLQIRV